MQLSIYNIGRFFGRLGKYLKKTKTLSKYKLEKWVVSLEFVLAKIIETKKGKINKEFWKQILYPDKVD